YKLRRHFLVCLDRSLRNQCPQIFFCNRYHYYTFLSKMILAKISDFEISLRFTRLIFLCDICPLVIKFLSFCKPDLHFDKTSFQIHPKGHKSHAFLLHLSEKFVDLLLVQKKFSDPKRVFVENISFFVRTDMHSVDEYLAVLNADEGFFDAAFS